MSTFRFRDGTTFTSTWHTDEIIDKMFDGGKRVLGEALDQFPKEYEKRAPELTGRLGEGFMSGDVREEEKEWGKAYYRKSLITYVPYAGWIEHHHPRKAKQGIKRKAAAATRRKMRERWRQTVVNQVIGRFS